MSSPEPLLRVRDLKVTFGVGHHAIQAVAGVSFDVLEGETLGLVGESGCGKSTTGKALMRIVEPSSGTIELDGVDLGAQKGKALRNVRTRMQMIFQDPISSLNPRRRIKDIVAEPLDCWKTVTGLERDAMVRPARQSRHRPQGLRQSLRPSVLRWSVPAHLDRTLARDAAQVTDL